MRIRAIVPISLALFIACASRARSQAAPPDSAGDAAPLLAEADAEAKRGVYLFYTQNYIDTKKERVDIHGSVYGVLRDLKLSGCDLEAVVQVFDLFSGFIKELPIGEQHDLTEYSIRIHLSRDLVFTLIQARPAQLAHTMHTQCDEDQSCAFNWLRIQSTKPGIRERVVFNHGLEFDGNVQQVLAPVSSKEAGTRLASDLELLSSSQCR